MCVTSFINDCSNRYIPGSVPVFLFNFCMSLIFQTISVRNVRVTTTTFFIFWSRNFKCFSLMVAFRVCSFCFSYITCRHAGSPSIYGKMLSSFNRLHRVVNFRSLQFSSGDTNGVLFLKFLKMWYIKKNRKLKYL